ncbi:MAG TPA: RNA pseudouridine synthase, partial [Syntrophomonas sp.]|nr:RNA pseudouridine synthase [Syntrophomonas sp.]
MNKRNYQERPMKHKQPTQLPVIEAGELMKFLLEKLPALTRNNIKSLLAHRQVMVDEQVVTRYNHPLQKGQE